MSYSIAVGFTVLGLLLWYWKRSRRSITYLPGPRSNSWLAGNIPSFQRAEQAAEADFEWTEKYGSAIRLKGCFGEDLLYTSDPKAMQHVLNKSGYNYPKTMESRIRVGLLSGPGILHVEGTRHARHRRVMNPSFSFLTLKGLLPVFLGSARKTTAKWTEMIRQQGSKPSVIDVSSLLYRTTLDALGEAAFGYKFNSVEGKEPITEFQASYQHVLADTSYMISDFTIAFRRVLGVFTPRLANLLTRLPKKDMRRFRDYMSISRRAATELVDKKMHDHTSGKETGKDVMSVLIRANSSEDPRRQIGKDEIVSQITTLLFAGHETTANTIGWLLYELSRHPDVQCRLRDEVRGVLAEVASRGDSEISISDLDSMTYMNAVMKETLRYHPIVPQLFRCARQDDVIPLSIPQRTVTGKKITAIPVRKGQQVWIGLASYNRLKSVWGEDAHQWRPERFLEEFQHEDKVKLGVYGNISSFSSGLRSCIGWRFALLEMQSILVELINNFQFTPVPDVEIKRVVCVLMQGMVAGQEEKGAQIPLTVSIFSNEDPNMSQ